MSHQQSAAAAAAAGGAHAGLAEGELAQYVAAASAASNMPPHSTPFTASLLSGVGGGGSTGSMAMAMAQQQQQQQQVETIDAFAQRPQTTR